MDWDEVYSNLITITGWTWEYIDDFMNLPRLTALISYWRKHPPVHVLVAGLAGYKAKEVSIEPPKNDLGELMDIFGTIGGKVNNG